MEKKYLAALLICFLGILPLSACQPDAIEESEPPITEKPEESEEPEEPEGRIIVITPNENNRAYIKNTEQTTYLPGDIIYLKGEFTHVWIERIEGSVEKPIRIMNYPGERLLISNPGWSGGALAQGFHIIYSHHLVIGGESAPTDLVIEGSTVEGSRGPFFCVNIKNFSDNIELKNMTIRDGGMGIMAKTDPVKDDPETWHPNNTLKNLSIHDIHIMDTSGEGMYIGHTAKKWGWDENGKGYNATDLDEEKAGHTYALPLLWENVEIYNMKVENCGWDAIQCSAIHGLHLHNNIAVNWGYRKVFGQCHGIINGGRNKDTYLHDNLLFNGYGEAIQSFGDKNSKHRFENNLIVGGKSTAIAVYDGGRVEITNNTIVDAGRYAVKANARKEKDPEVVWVKNNVFIEMLQINRESWATDFYFHLERGALLEDVDNKKFDDIKEAKVDSSNYYQPLAGSPIGNAGYRKKSGI